VDWFGYTVVLDPQPRQSIETGSLETVAPFISLSLSPKNELNTSLNSVSSTSEDEEEVTTVCVIKAFDVLTVLVSPCFNCSCTKSFTDVASNGLKERPESDVLDRPDISCAGRSLANFLWIQEIV
jgi:hypothetical protein